MNLKFNLTDFQKDYKVKTRIDVFRVCQSDRIKNNSVLFNLKPDDAFFNELLNYSELIVFVPEGINNLIESKKDILIITVKNPRLAYVLFTTKYLVKEDISSGYKENSSVHDSSYISESATLMPDVFVGPNCKIEDNCYLSPGVKILGNVSIGSDTIIGANTVIGQPGFGVEKDNDQPISPFPKNGFAYKMPHFGGVVIGSNCNFGSLNTIVAGAIEPTVVGNNVQTDDHVHIAHNCKISDGVLIAAHAEISGSVTIQDDTWVGPNCSIMQKVVIGKESVIGLGAVIKKSIPEKSIISALPGKNVVLK